MEIQNRHQDWKWASTLPQVTIHYIIPGRYFSLLSSLPKNLRLMEILQYPSVTYFVSLTAKKALPTT